MALKKAETLDDQQFPVMMKRLRDSVRRPHVESVVFLLSYKAGLRSQEIAGLEWDRHILDADGEIRRQEYLVAGSKGRAKREMLPVVWVSSDIGKYGAERKIRMHDSLFEAIVELRGAAEPGKFVIPSGKSGAKQNLKSRAHALTVRINRYYEMMGLDKCTSHSGRRTFISTAARRANFANCHLGDVQHMAGHKQLTTTQEYLDTTAQQADLIGLL